MPATLFRAAADLVVVAHLAFVLFVVLGGLLALRWRRIVWFHVPAALWGAAIEFAGGVCPLTPLETYLRRLGGSAAYEGDFVERYLLPLLYPAPLTREIQIALGALVLVVNLAIYGRILRRRGDAPPKRPRFTRSR